MDLKETEQSTNGTRESEQSSNAVRVLLVEDNPGDVSLMKEMLGDARSSRFVMTLANRLKAAIQIIEDESPDVVLLDLGLPDSSGLATLERLISKMTRTPIIVLTGLTDIELGLKAMTMGAQDYLVKGEVDSTNLERAIHYAIQRKKILEELRESNDRYVSLFQDNNAIMFLIDPVTARVVDVNQSALDFYGYSRDQFIGLSIEDINTLTMEELEDCLKNAASRTQGHFLFTHRLADGQHREVEVISGPIHIKKKTYLYSIIHDITARKRAEEERARLSEEVEEQKGLLQTVIENAPAGILAVSGPDLEVKWANQAIARMSGRSVWSELSGGKPLTQLSGGFFGLNDRIKEAQRKNVAIIEAEVETTLADGKAAFLYISIVPIPMKGGERGALVMLMDITEQVSARHRIEEMVIWADTERRRVNTILESLPVGVVVADQDGRTMLSNDLVDSIWGGKVPSITSLSDYRILKGWWADNGMTVRPDDWPIIRAIRKGEVPVGEVIDIQRLDGTRGTILSSASPIRDASGKIIGGVSVVQDITRQRKLEHDAIEAKEHAELYIDLLSHDISNMNAAVSSYLQAAVEKVDIEQQNMKYFTKSQEILENSNELIETVRKIQRVESHDSKYGMVDLGWLLEDIRADYEHYPGREVKINYKTAIKKFVMAGDLLRDVFTNLVSNSIKHSTGPVEISIVLNKVFEGGREHYKVTIEDDGPGIPDDLKRKLFQRKQRGKTKATGSGLGLYLVRKLVEDLNGRVWVEDRMAGDPSQGSRFVVLLPAVSNDPRPMA
ncbi:MAG: PAS domain S-box protein [Methanomassiliicoccus sp.]|nr:PAS domain S-box protein [Methanomassiliicoccus sp.]